MRGGNWETNNSVTVQRGGTPRPLGGYQPNMIAEPHSPATPWQMHNTIKQEPLDEDRNDSGVTSGGSDMQSSPSGSENSQDVNIQKFTSASGAGIISHCPRISYVSTPMIPKIANSFNNATVNLSPKKNSFSHCDAHQNQQPATSNSADITPVGSPASSYKESGDERQDTIDPLRRLQLSVETNTLLPTSPRSNEISIDAESKNEIEFDEYDEQGLRVPKVNSHGKVKTYKCKQCEFIAVTKLDFWEHSRSHIKSDKLLTCPKCPFGTEYKHHLEYHIRNHYGSKPFKCNQCSYSCVNKSMLNSHMKSHSNVYQYRCADCSYATKYCHSLKLHLRKYDHQPDMVLNPDGTPNPLPIIDVYGTRRGPKQKIMIPKPREIGDEPQPPQLLQNSLAQLMLNSQLPMPFGYPLFGGFPGGIPNPLFFQQNLMPNMANNGITEDQQKVAETVPIQGGSASSINPCDVLDLSIQEGTENDENYSSTLTAPRPPIKNRRKGVAVRLDLNKAEDVEREREYVESEESDSDKEMENNNNENHSNQHDDANLKNSPEEEKMDTEQAPRREVTTDNNNEPKRHYCRFCCISFEDVVMYSMHIGYHGYNDPFTCNMCGQKCDDRVSFFLHIARTPHT
ncbi:hb [Trypoxylus dichotomus]